MLSASADAVVAAPPSPLGGSAAASGIGCFNPAQHASDVSPKTCRHWQGANSSEEMQNLMVLRICMVVAYPYDHTLHFRL